MQFKRVFAVGAVLGVAGLVFGLVGCDKGQAVPEKGGVAADEVIVKVNGTALTQSQLNRRVGLMLKVVTGNNPKITDQALESTSNQLYQTFPQVFVMRTLVSDYAAKEKIQVPAATLEKYQKLALRKMQYLRVKDYASLRKKLGGDAALFDEQVREEALLAAVKDHVVAANPTNLPPGYADQVLKDSRAYNARMTATNALIYARATNVWEQLKSGAEFADMIQRHSQLDEERLHKGEWGTFDRKILGEFPQVLKWVLKAYPGDFSPPLEGDNGLLILRLDSKDDEKDEYALTRIFFQLPLFADELSEAELTEQVRKEHGEKVWQETVERLRAQAKIEFTESKAEKDNKKEKAK